MSATSGSDEPIVDGTVMVTSADRETTTVLLPVMVVWHGVARRAAWRGWLYLCSADNSVADNSRPTLGE